MTAKRAVEKAGPVEQAVRKRTKSKLPIVAWALSRLEGGQGGRWVRCYWHEEGERKQAFPVTPPPTVELLGDRWGSGEYRVTMIPEGGGIHGGHLVTVDDPGKPTKPTYPNRPAAEVPTAPVNGGQRDLASLMLAAKGDDPMAMLLVYRALDRDARDAASREADQRVARMLADTAQTIERERRNTEAEMRRQQQFYDAMLKVHHPPADDDDDTDDRLALLEERIASGGASPEEKESGVDFAMRQVGGLLSALKDRPEIMSAVLEKLGVGGAK